MKVQAIDFNKFICSDSKKLHFVKLFNLFDEILQIFVSEDLFFKLVQTKDVENLAKKGIKVTSIETTFVRTTGEALKTYLPTK